MRKHFKDDQKQQIDFSDTVTSISGNRRTEYTNVVSQPFFGDHTSFERLDNEQIRRFENFFETYVYPPRPEKKITLKAEDGDPHDIIPSRDLAQISQLEKDLLQFELDEIAQNEDLDDNNDLIYLNALLNSGGQDHAGLQLDSLSVLFDEITGNEKTSSSNYESSIFDANIQSIFGETTHSDDIKEEENNKTITEDKKEPVDDTVEDLPAQNSLIEVLPELAFLDFELPDAPLASTEKDESALPISPDELVEDTAKNSEESSPEVENVVSNQEETKIVETKRKKKLTFLLFDSILVLIIIIAVLVLLITFSDRLPFDIPFL